MWHTHIYIKKIDDDTDNPKPQKNLKIFLKINLFTAEHWLNLNK